jgi:hypothetical protein
MIKKALLILMASASLTIANSAKAGLGWSLSECRDHYGNSLQPNPTSDYGRQKYLFRTGEYNISVWLLDDMVSSITYKKVNGGVVSPSEIGTLLQVNAPKADWSIDPERDSTGIFWGYGKVSRDPFAYQADYTRDGAVNIFTRADLEMKNMEKDFRDKDL